MSVALLFQSLVIFAVLASNIHWQWTGGDQMSMGKKKVKTPIMSDGEERFMAFEGLVQWTNAAIEQGRRVAAATSKMRAGPSQENTRLSSAQLRSDHHYFAIAANKVLEHRDWVRELGLCSKVDFTMLDKFSSGDIRDLRNMREHVVDYFKGIGQDKPRWEIETPEFKADASSSAGTLIGGRLDWMAFAAAAEILLTALLVEPIIYPDR
jgi:hypothetical protein